MNLRIVLAGSIAVLLPLGAVAADALTSLHPEEAYPDNIPPLASPGPYADFNKRVQRKLHEQGFDGGPINGDFGSKSQAALVQFQLSRGLPASGMLDDRTLAELGVEREARASTGASADSSAAGVASAPSGGNPR